MFSSSAFSLLARGGSTLGSHQTRVIPSIAHVAVQRRYVSDKYFHHRSDASQAGSHSPNRARPGNDNNVALDREWVPQRARQLQPRRSPRAVDAAFSEQYGTDALKSSTGAVALHDADSVSVASSAPTPDSQPVGKLPSSSPKGAPSAEAPYHKLTQRRRREVLHDPALSLEIRSGTRDIKLNAIQENMVWEARQREYHSMLQKVVLALESHQTPLEKCYTLLALHDEIIQKRLRLRVDTYEEIFHVFYAVGTMGSRQRAELRKGNEWRDSAWKRKGDLSTPLEFRGVEAAESIVSPAFLQNIWTMYRYMVDSGTNPSPRVIQHVMGLLEQVQGRNAEVEAKAHSLVLDCDRFKLTPTEYTLASYIGVCTENNVMHLALGRYTDMKTRHERQLSSGVCARLIVGLVRNGHYDEAMSTVATLGNVAVSTYLLNAVLYAARYSNDPSSAFTMYRSICQPRHRGSSKQGSGTFPGRDSANNGVIPSIHTFGVLVDVMKATGDGSEARFVLSEMRRYGVKGHVKLLNRLLGILLEESSHSVEDRKAFEALRSAMRARQTLVFDEYLNA